VYSDHAVKSGTPYRYAITAVDQKNNASEKSPAVEAVAP
jgi:fibronectin type 3 domain-containing protein